MRLPPSSDAGSFPRATVIEALLRAGFKLSGGIGDEIIIEDADGNVEVQDLPPIVGSRAIERLIRLYGAECIVSALAKVRKLLH